MYLFSFYTTSYAHQPAVFRASGQALTLVQDYLDNYFPCAWPGLIFVGSSLKFGANRLPTVNF